MWTQWPPANEGTRLADYRRFESLLDGRHAEAFAEQSAKVPKGKRSIIYIIANFAGLVSKVCADLLFGEGISFTVGEPDSPEQLALDAMLERNGFRVALWESAISNSARGDAVFKLWRDELGQACIQEMSAGNYVADLDPDNVRRVTSEALAWEREDARGQEYLRIERHVPGLILNELWELETGGQLGRQVPLSLLYGDQAPAEEEQTGIDRSLLWHVPNWRIGSRYYGYSDYVDLETLQDEVNNRVSKIAGYLDKHAAPKLVVPRGVLDPNGNISAGSLEVIEVTSPELGKDLPRYVTWDGQLDSAFREIEMLEDLLHKVSEIAPAVFGLDKAGAIESGKALKLRFIRTLAKINRKRAYYDPAIRSMLATALQLEGVTVTPDDVQIGWRDGLPQDYSAAVVDESALYIAGLTSARSAIVRVQGVSEAEADEELALIAEEKSASMQAAQQAFSLDSMMNGGDVNQQQNQQDAQQQGDQAAQ